MGIVSKHQVDWVVSGLNFISSSDTHPSSNNIGDAYFNTKDQHVYVNDGKNWVILSVAKSSDEYLMENRRKKIEKIIKRYETNR